MKTGDTLKLKGIFTLRIFKDGKLLEKYVDKNLVVNLGRQAAASLIANGDVNKIVTQISFGDNNTSPTVSDSAITNQYKKTLDSYSFPSPGSVLFAFTLGNSEANGLNISEYGLQTADNTLFARKVRSSILKDNTISFTGTWEIIL